MKIRYCKSGDFYYTSVIGGKYHSFTANRSNNFFAALIKVISGIIFVLSH